MRGSLAAMTAGLAFSVAGAPAPAADLTATVRSQQGTPVADAVVVAMPSQGLPKPAAASRAEIAQVDFEFVPRVKAVRVGTAVDFPNRDNARHHVYSFSPARRFELPLYSGTPPAPILFDRPGVVVLGCNIHDWMIGYLYVSESPYFAQTGADGTARISNLPAGSYRLQVWHPLLDASEESTRRAVSLGASESSSQGWQVPLRPEVHIPRTKRAPR
jgi:plastocyanin